MITTKFKELGKSSSLAQKFILILSLALFNWIGMLFVALASGIGWDNGVGILWAVTWIPYSIYLTFHLFPKKD